MLDNKKVIVVGTGYMAGEHIRALKTLGVRNLSMFGRNVNRARKRANEYNVKPLTGTLSQILVDESPTHVIVAVDLKSQEDIYTQLVTLSDQYFLLLEKPLALTYRRALDLLSISAQPENIFVAVNRRFYPEMELVRAALASQKGLRHVSVTDQESYWPHSRGTNIFEMRRTAIMSNSIHLVDLVTMLCRGNLDEITPMWNLSNQTNCLLIRSREGDICSYTFQWDIPGPWSLAISTESLYAELNPLETVRFRTKGTRKWFYGDTPPAVNDLKRGLLEQANAFLAIPSARDFRLQTIKAHLPSVRLAENLARWC